MVADLPAATIFYQQAFGAEEVVRLHGPDGTTVFYAEVKIDGSIIALGAELPQMKGWLSPQSLGGTSITLTLYVEDADATFKSAIDAGAEELLPPHDAFWGDRHSRVRDPAGHEWVICTQLEEHLPEEIDARAKKFFKAVPKEDLVRIRSTHQKPTL
jgi:PhnB protein